MRTDSCPDIYAWVLERAAALVAQGGRTGMIVPLSLGFSGDFAGCRELLYRAYGHNWFSSFGRIPAALFNFDVRVRNTIHLGHRSRQARANFTTRLHRWFDVERPSLLPLMEYSAYDPCLWGGRVPKIGKTELCAAFERAIRCKRGMVNDLMLDRRATSILHFKKTAYNWINFCRQLPPCFEKTGKPIPHTQFDIAAFADVPTRDLCFLLLNGKLVYCFWAAVGDDFHVARWMFSEFPLNPAHLPHDMVVRLRQYVAPLEKAMAEATSFKLNAGKNVGNYNLARCRHITDHSDRIFAEHLGIAGVWDQLELYYSQIVKTDFDDEE